MFNFTNPVMEKVINQAYMGVIKNVPKVWDYLYDNPKIVKGTQKIKNSIHKRNSKKLEALMDSFEPDGVVCTQAFPCGMIADFKKSRNLSMPIFGVLTDYAPHSYWVYDNVDAYIVPVKETGEKFIESGVPPAKIKPFGIPIHPKFKRNLNNPWILKNLGLDENLPVILLMGGGQGLGPIKKIINALDGLTMDFQIISVTGSNKRLYNYLKRKQKRYKKKMYITSFANNIDELMSVSTLIVTKPGGLTTAEALTKHLPMVIIDPLPGQETLNTNFLLKKGLVVKVKDEFELGEVVLELLKNPKRINNMCALAKKFARPDAAIKTAKLILKS